MEQGRQDIKIHAAMGWKRILGILLSIACIITVAVGLVAQGKTIYKNLFEQEATRTDYSNYLNDLLSSSYTAYYYLQLEKEGKEILPEDIFFRTDVYLKDILEDEYEGYEEFEGYNPSYQPDILQIFNEQYAEDVDRLKETIDYGENMIFMNEVDYLMISSTDEKFVRSQEDGGWNQIIMSGSLTEEIKSQYPLLLLIRYNSNGVGKVLDCYGTDLRVAEDHLYEYRLENRYGTQSVNEITDCTLLVGLNQKGIDRLNEDYGYISYRVYDQFENVRFPFAMLIASLVILLVTVLFMAFRLIGIDQTFIARMPVELVLAVAFGDILVAIGLLNPLTFHLGSGELARELTEMTQAMGITLHYNGVAQIVCIAVWTLAFAVEMSCLVAFFVVFKKGLKRYLKENCLLVRFFAWCVHLGKRVYQNITNFDFDDRINKVTLKIVAVNAIVIAVMCSIWVFGWGILIVYSILLFYLLRKYLRKVQQNYENVLAGTKEMASGNLNVKIDDAGIFQPLCQELMQVKEGFAHAVEEEVKSQNMRTELISNVSHDLKTPLTAIITYVDLLKDETITEEQRRDYIATLDQKSLRLKQLIEDLFEVSKLNSNNVQLQFVSVDIIAMLKQVQLEYQETLQEQKIELVSRMPQEKIVLWLDSQKTYRIYENLFNNIIKYGMPNTRAYVEVMEEESEVIISLKNISEHIIEVEGELLTERFVRGDTSRNTEGSGLGLAIVKSLVEKQGGRLEIIVDGDLFKTVIHFPKSVSTKQEKNEVI